jgi:hypothetical protein
MAVTWMKEIEFEALEYLVRELRGDIESALKRYRAENSPMLDDEGTPTTKAEMLESAWKVVVEWIEEVRFQATPAQGGMQ